MRPIGFLVSLLCATVLLQPHESIAAAPDQTSVTSGFLRVHGDQFVLYDHAYVMRGFNYYPRNYGWSAMTDWDWSEVDQELTLAAASGANTIRTVIDYGFSTDHPSADWQPAAVSQMSHPTPAYLAAMNQLLTIADRHGLRVVFSLFDFMPGWAFVDQAEYAPATTYASELVGPFANDPRLAAWDILNEGDLLPDKFPTTTQAAVLGFYAAMSASIRAVDHRHLVTADFGNIERAHLSQDFVDYVSFHYYADQARLTHEIDALRGRLRHPMPVVAGELGAPSAGNQYATMSSHIVALGAYLDSALNSRALAGALIWTLVDPNPPRTPRSRQSHMDLLAYGIYDGNLNPKPSAGLVRRYFGDACAADLHVELRFPGSPSPIAGDSRALTIGLHQLELLGHDGASLRVLKFGTLEADALDGQGWYANEDWGQWIGQLGGTATLCLAVPPEAASLSLTAHALQADTQLEVWVDGAQLGSASLQRTTAEYVFALS